MASKLARLIAFSCVYLDDISEQYVRNTVHLLDFFELVSQAKAERLELQIRVLSAWIKK